MKARTLWLTVTFVVAAEAQAGSRRQITLAELRDKIEGGWAGQMIGVSFGAPTEFRALGRIFEEPLPPWKPERVKNSLDQDDLYVDMTLARVLDDKGLEATTEEFAAAFAGTQYRLWHANLAARRNLRSFLLLVNKSDLWQAGMPLDKLMLPYSNEIKRLNNQAARLGYRVKIQSVSVINGTGVDDAMRAFFNTIRPLPRPGVS
jgi:hypothetical protein